MNNKEKEVIVVNESSDKSDCFAWISKNKRNALSSKECSFTNIIVKCQIILCILVKSI